MKRLFFFGLWLLFVALLLQLAGWVYFTVGGAKPIQGYGYPSDLFVSHPQRGFAYRPGFVGEFRGAGFRDVQISINEDGFRDAHFDIGAATRTESPPAKRVAFLGDSVVFGAGVSAEQRFTDCLEQDVDGWSAPDVLNLGVNSYSMGHYLALLEAGLPADVDALVVGLTLNDFADMETAGPYRRLERRKQGLHSPPWWERSKERLDATYAGRFVGELKTRVRYALMNADRREEYHTKWMRTVVDAWNDPETVERFGENLDRLAALAGNAGQSLGLVLFPELNDLLDPDAFSGPRRTVLNLISERDLRVCDPYDAFAAKPNPERLFLPHDSVHYNADGHRLTCEVLRACLSDWGFDRGPSSTAASR
jgi:hypothetical protein